MANLNSWQKITRVLPGLPFGDGIDGSYNSSTIPTMTYRSCSGSSGSRTLTLGFAGFSNGDLILIHQTRGTGAGQWEINRVVSGGGTTSLTLQTPLQYTYTDSGNSQAQAVKIPRYTNVTVPSGANWTVPDWNGDVGGIFVFAAKKTTIITGTVTANGKGYVGAVSSIYNNWNNYGEGTNGAASTSSPGSGAPNGSGGGGGKDAVTTFPGGGGGGGHATAGTNGSAGSGGGGGTGGVQVGSANLSNLLFGGGGGAGGAQNDTSWHTGGTGGKGGGIFITFSKNLTITGAISSAGLAGGNASTKAGGGGGGAGGAILMVCAVATLGTNRVTSAAGSGGAGNSGGGNGGAGSVGRIAIHYSVSYSGSTNPTLYANQDPSLVQTSGGGSFLYNFI